MNAQRHKTKQVLGRIYRRTTEKNKLRLHFICVLLFTVHCVQQTIDLFVYCFVFFQIHPDEIVLS